jgi:ATP adenylyltransferase/5',5'''-P-1,P-4-tetraphosphate phosphorylase II
MGGLVENNDRSFLPRLSVKQDCKKADETKKVWRKASPFLPLTRDYHYQ